MSKTSTFMAFVTLGTLIISAIHYYLWLRLVRDTGLMGSLKDLGTYALIALAVSFPTAVFERLVSSPGYHPVCQSGNRLLGSSHAGGHLQ